MKKIYLSIWILLIILGEISLMYLYIDDLSSNQARKPAIYFYPEKEMELEIKLDINGFITKSEPSYENGWTITVNKDGIINNLYEYLFYEAKLNKIDLPNEGWCVQYNQLEYWMKVYLAKLGLNHKEIEDFKEFWLVELPYSEYYVIKLLSNEFLDENMKVTILPSPDLFLRIELVFLRFDYHFELIEPVINSPNRIGFTVVEWGGILV